MATEMGVYWHHAELFNGVEDEFVAVGESTLWQRLDNFILTQIDAAGCAVQLAEARHYLQ